MLVNSLLAILVLSRSAFCGNMHITLWQSEDCKGDNDLKPNLDLQLHLGCFKRGDVADQLEVEMNEGLRQEMALSAWQDGSLQAQSQAVVFFTSEDCDPDTEIMGAYVDDSCSDVFPELRGDTWQSYEMRDVCLGEDAGCDLDEEVEGVPNSIPGQSPNPRVCLGKGCDEVGIPNTVPGMSPNPRVQLPSK